MGQALDGALHSLIDLVKSYLTAYSDESWGCNGEHLGHAWILPQGRKQVLGGMLAGEGTTG